MQRDYLGNPVSGSDPATLHRLDEFTEGFLAYETRAERILQTAQSDPASCMANTYAGMLWMLLEARPAPLRARKYLQTAEGLAASATRREQLNVAVLRAWVDDDMPLTLRLCDQVSDEFPRDLAIVKIHQYLEFNRGNAPAMLKVALKVSNAAADIPYVHGMSAFGYEQCHLLEEAQTAARRAIDMRHKEPWAQHALAHVLLTRGLIDEGAQFLEGLRETWTGLNSFMLTHLWWHLALFYISQGRDGDALQAFDRHCWGVAKTYSQDQVGAVSLLARLELAGIDVGPRWEDVADHLEVRADDTLQPFLTLQYLYGLARGGRPQAALLLEAAQAFAKSAPDHSRRTWQEVAVPAAEGLYAYAKSDHERARVRLALAIPRLAEIGGSHAQRDLFEQIFVDATLKCGQLVEAQQMLELRRKADPLGVPVNHALASVYERLGLVSVSLQALARAADTRSRHAPGKNANGHAAD
jgi:hypothetical protein